MSDALVFPGVRSARFIGYLHGLALLRVVTEQLDPTARAAWSHGSFLLTTTASRDELLTFFVERWRPTPALSPWNGSSGFLAGDKQRPKGWLDLIETSTEPRLEDVRVTIAACRSALASLGLTEKPKDAAKTVLLRHLRATLADVALLWLDAAVVLAGTDIAFPAALGSGGNEGNFNLAVNNAHCLVELFGLDEPPRLSPNRALLDAFLSGASTPARDMSMGHLSQGPGANLWDLPLAVEGLMVLAAGASRRGESTASAQAAAPFSVRPSTGFGSAVAGESGRAEQWMPVWEEPATLAEIRVLLREGRASVGRRRASSGLDVARAAGELGVARGIAAFERFAILERVGRSHLTLHAGTIEVRERPVAAALRGLDTRGWLSRVLSPGAEKPPTARRQAARQPEEAAFAMAVRGRTIDVEAVLRRLGQMELVQARAGASRAKAGDGPGLRGIRPPATPWVATLDHDDPAVRVAVALGSLVDGSEKPQFPWLRDLLNGTRWAELKPELVGNGASYEDGDAPLVPASGSARRRLLALHLRREVDAASSERRGPAFDFGLPAALADLTLLATDRLDTERVLALAAGLALLDFRGCRPPVGPKGGFTAPALAALALVVHHRELGDASDQDAWRVPAAIVSRLAAGAVLPVLRDALARMRQAGHAPFATAADLTAGAPTSRGLAIALLARPRVSDLHAAVRHLTVHSPSPEDVLTPHTEQEPSS